MLAFDSAATAELARIAGRGRREVTGAEGSRVVWRIWGAGPPLLLLHGGSGAWSHWIRNIEPLSALYTVIAADIPGHGESEPAGEDPARVAAALWQGLDTLLGGPALLPIVGFSFGGAVGAQMAHMRPHRVERLVLVGSGGMRVTRPDTAPMTKWRKLTDPDAILQAHRSNLEALMLHDASRVDALAILLQATNTRAARIKSRNISREINLGALLEGCPVPLAGIWGAHDATAKGFIGERKALIRHLDPDAEFHTIEDAGHWVQYEAAPEFNRILLDILNARRPRDASHAGRSEATLQQGENG